MIRFLTLVLITLVLSGCAYVQKKKHAFIPDKSKTYLKSQETPPLQVPVGIPADSVGDKYTIPRATAPAPTTQPSLLPPDSLADQIAQGKVSPDVLNKKPAKKSITS